jgi:hypothetical protein
LSRRAGLTPAYRLEGDLSGILDAPGDPNALPAGDRDVLPTGDRAVLPAGDRDVVAMGGLEVLPAGDLDALPAGALDAAADRIVWDRAADGYRLPTEAEWEHACRAGTTGPRYGPLDEIAWYRDNSDGRVHDVGGKQPNAWGLHDMLGNVWDWCWDVYDPEIYGTYRVLRGGGWFDEHWSCRASVRRRSHPTFRVDDVGFRVVRSGSGALPPPAVGSP